VLGGYGQGSSAYANGYGRYWSSTYYGATSAYNLAFSSGTVWPQISRTKYYGFAVRCVKNY